MGLCAHAGRRARNTILNCCRQQQLDRWRSSGGAGGVRPDGGRRRIPSAPASYAVLHCTAGCMVAEQSISTALVQNRPSIRKLDRGSVLVAWVQTPPYLLCRGLCGRRTTGGVNNRTEGKRTHRQPRARPLRHEAEGRLVPPDPAAVRLAVRGWQLYFVCNPIGLYTAY